MKDNAEIRRLQKEFIKARETGRDVAPILKELAEVRAKIAMAAEAEAMDKIVAQRQALKGKAEAVKVKVQKQNDSITTFLKLRDSITEALMPILEQAKELPKLQEACYEQYHDAFVFEADIRQITKGYLSMDGFSCPILEMASGVTRGYDTASQAFFYLQSGYGLLANLKKGEMIIPQKSGGEFDGELEVDPYPVSPCKLCQHPDREAIDKALQNGRSLRDIEAEFEGVSRSSLSRHKAHIEQPALP